MESIRLIHEIHEQWARENGYRDKDQASSSKPENLHAENTNRFVKAASPKRQATSLKRQASSSKRQAASSKVFWISIQLVGDHGPWPIATSSWILFPGTSFRDLWPRALTKINVFFGCDLWNEIWCGENLTLFPRVTFNSTVKKCPEVLYPNRSGQPSMLRFSIRIHWREHVFFLRSCHNFRSGLTAFFKVTRV